MISPSPCVTKIFENKCCVVNSYESSLSKESICSTQLDSRAEFKILQEFSCRGTGSIKGTGFRLPSYSFANISDSNAKGEMADFTGSNEDVETGVYETKCQDLGVDHGRDNLHDHHNLDCHLDLGEDHGGNNLHDHYNLDSHLDLEEESNNDKRVFTLLTEAIRCIGALTGIVVFIYEFITNYLY